MKINRWIALALIALLLIGAMGFVSYRVFASANGSRAFQDCSAETQDQENEANEASETEDSGVEECGQSGEAEDGDGNEATEANGQDVSDEIAPAQTGITAEQAQTIVEAANPGAITLNVEFDREGGKELWEVELDNGMDVKVDATTGEFLSTEKRD